MYKTDQPGYSIFFGRELLCLFCLNVLIQIISNPFTLSVAHDSAALLVSELDRVRLAAQAFACQAGAL